MNYIPAEKLIAEIERLKKQSEYSKKELINEGYNQNAFAEDCRIASFDKLLSFIAYLQQEQPGVDLEKEIQDYIKECLDVKFPTTDIEQIKKDVAYTARKFYELGLNARKEE